MFYSLRNSDILIFNLITFTILQVWDVRTKKMKLDLPGHADEVFAVDWSPDGGMVASGGKDRVLKLWKH